MTNSPGWAVELVGEKFDLDDLRNDQAPPFDLWVEDYATDNRSACRALPCAAG
jgi:hypothetical protein